MYDDNYTVDSWHLIVVEKFDASLFSAWSRTSGTCFEIVKWITAVYLGCEEVRNGLS